MNMKNRCLYCYKEIDDTGLHYHPQCAMKLFGMRQAPVLPYNRNNIEQLALQIIEKSTSITGVQPKLALDINRGGKNEPNKLTIVGLWGNFILKPQSSQYAFLPEIEDVTMKMASACGIETVPHGLIRMDDGELAYITRRVDRDATGKKFSMLDMCQLTNRLTEHKYRGAYIQLAETIKRYSISPMLDVQRFWELVLFSWITGNSDMHCKNFSLLEYPQNGYRLSPAYDLLSVKLVDKSDTDELAMPLLGAGVLGDTPIVNFKRESFIEAMTLSGITYQVAAKLIVKQITCKEKWFAIIDSSFLSEELKEQYKSLISKNLEKLKA